ncbi:MAG TPA: AAC(3) family N-acetyltransferase [Methyloceanibacter sp.]|jgi:aminoglycoside N3'-acetyltransferase|nr:AAC(3) family N-acetyltransferase [Methyloceanibacter sp.]
MSLARPPRPVADIVQDLRAIGVAPADTLMVHASLRALGPVASGADGVLNALDAAVGPEGTLLMILGAEIAHDWVNRRPEAERPALLADAPPFDPQTTPVFHEVGTLAEVFRRRPGTIVTDNPSGRFGARGGNAEALLADAPWNDYYGPGSPLERLCAMGGRVLRLGAGPDTTTVLHLAEYLAEIPNKRRVRRHYRCMTAAGPATCAVECLDDEHGIVAREGEDYFAAILREFLATSRAKQGRVGTAQSELIEAEDLVRFGARWMSETLA